MSQVMYRSDELVSVSNILKGFSGYLENLKTGVFEKIGLLKNNTIEAVIIPKSRYEELEEIERIMDFHEHSEIYKQVKDRLNAKPEDYISFDEMVKKHNISI